MKSEKRDNLLSDFIIAHYRILQKIGAGGMGEVYLAKDTKLERLVALKLLPEGVASDAERMRRFVQEAKAAAALNHPSIAHIYEIGEAEDGTRFIAMEYVDGATLREKIYAEKTPLKKLLAYLLQVAEGLAKAHAAGIVHRDLKPDNIMISADGYGKILDFGLAKLIEPPKQSGDAAQSEVATAILAQHSLPGMVMGTAGYMSPEQALGKVKEIDYRSDIFSFGCILFEAATGRKAFEGKDALDSLHKIVHAPTPQIKETNADAPADLQRIVRRCLQKDPERRYQSIKEVAIELEELLQELKLEETEPPRFQTSTASGAAISKSVDAPGTQTVSQTQTSAAIEPPRSTSSAEYLVGEIKRHRTGMFIALAALVVAAGIAFALYKFSNRTSSDAEIASFKPGKIERLTGKGNVLNAAISPDGKFVVYLEDETGQQSISIRDVATTSSVQIVAPAEFRYTGLNFSPDGNYVYFSRTDRDGGASDLYQVPKLGGTPKKILSGADTSVSFSPDGKRLAFVRSPDSKDSALVVADVDGSNEQKLAALTAPEFFANQPPAWSPDGKIIACSIYHVESNGFYATVVGVNVGDGSIQPLTAHRWTDTFGKMAWEPGGGSLLLSAREKSFLSNAAQIWRVAYPSGEARQITESLTSYISVSLSADARSLISISDDIQASLWTMPVAQPNAARQISATPGTKDGYCGVAWTNDNSILYAAKQIALTDIWRMNMDGTGQRQLTTSDEVERYPSLSRDNRFVVFDLIGAGGSHIFRADAADGGNLKQLTSGSYDTKPNVSPDGKWVVYVDGDSHLQKVSIDGGEPVQLTDKLTDTPAFSPDGKTIACYYKPDKGAAWKLALIPAEGGGGQPSKIFDAGSAPNTLNGAGSPRLWLVLRWTPDARSILYVADGKGASNVWSQAIAGGKPVQITDFKTETIWTFDLSPDGKQLALSRGRYITDVVLIGNAK